MKKTFVLLFAMAMSLSAVAQVVQETELEPKNAVELNVESKDELVTKKNHISINFCDYLVELFGGALISALSGDKFDEGWGAISVTYTHNLTKRWQLGGQVTIGLRYATTTIMPVASFDYYRNSWFKISGEAGAGVMFNKDMATFAAQIYPAVLRFGNDGVAGFVKVGVGTMGFVGAGIQFGI